MLKENIRLPSYSKYIRYHAYAFLKQELISSIRERNTLRVSSSTLQKIIQDCKENIISRLCVDNLSNDDDLLVLIKKHNTYAWMEDYKIILNEAERTYRGIFLELDRPTINSLNKKLQPIIDSLVEQLLEL